MVPSMLCSGCLAGYAAGCTFNQFEPILLDESWKSRSLNTPRLGLLIGLVSTAFLLLQVPVGIWLVSRYSTFPEPRIPSSITKYPRVIWKFISGKRYNESFKQSWCRRLFFIVLWYLCGALRYLCCFVLARNTIPGVAKQARASFMVKSTLAIMTLSFSSLMPALQLMWARVFIGCLLKQRHSVVHLKALRYYIVTWVILFLIVTGVAVGLDAASACIIANIAQKLGTFSVSPKSLAATAAVFSAISNLWPFIAFGTLLICPVFLTLAGFT
ncbi:uncharacterized protein F4822DRAFT_9594 [Hypoxylon trugodes]|uniref:uncharacterized protein n=1 Tax=Hypoxylon trugodes TaxID=326681 RepID=UPI00219F4408|nr:uncharacterized protein F4822DRAFT_9594 [Hypoxylon trugodes]KAI1393367.1 hypothetical protein F4822DRAFT_9594 [Hypoxylon trugodes]